MGAGPSVMYATHALDAFTQFESQNADMADKNAADEISPSYSRPASLNAIVSGQLVRLKG